MAYLRKNVGTVTGIATQAELDTVNTAVGLKASSTDLVGVRQDITALALREATNESSVAFNLPSSFIDTFTNSTNLGTLTDSVRDATGHHCYSATTTATEYDYNGAATGHNLVRWASMDGNNDTWREIDTDGDSSYAGTKNIIPAIGISANAYAAHTAQNVGDGVYFKFDYGISRSWGDKIKIGKHTPTGNVAQHKVLISEDDVTYTAWDMSAISQLGSSVYASGAPTSGGGVTGGTSAGIINMANYTGGEYTVVSTIQDVPTVTARYMKISNNAFGAGNNNAGMMQWAPYELSFAIAATGTLIQSTNTVASSKTKVAGVMLYKDEEGTATIGADLRIYFSCNGGTNWAEAASYTAVTPVYSTGVEMVKLGETTCTSGTDVRYKAVWASQTSGSKETQLHGIGLNY